MSEDRELKQQFQRIEELVGKIESIADPIARASAHELIQSLMDLHGAGINRMLEITADAGEEGIELIDKLAADKLVASLLLLYGLHPLDLETRVMQALDKVRPYLQSHGGNVELLGVDDGLLRLRLQGSCHGCGSSAQTLKLAIEEAIYDLAPDIAGLQVEGVVEQQTTSGLVQLQNNTASNNGDPWTEVNGLDSLDQGAARTIEVRGRAVLFCRLEETFYAYSSTCRACGEALEGARLDIAALVCPNCGHRYDIMGAGRGLDKPEVFLEPFPLLIEQGIARVALPV